MPRKPVQVSKDDYMEGVFPVRGIDVSCEYGRQPAGTAPEGVNVRAYDDLNRQRGASRVGISRWVDETVSGDHEIQHLAVIVTTAPVNLLAAVFPDLTAGTFMLDPSSGSGRNPGRYILIGGSGVQPNRNVSNIQADDVPNFFGGSVTHSGGGSDSIALQGGGSKSLTNLGSVPHVTGERTLGIFIGTTYFSQGGL